MRLFLRRNNFFFLHVNLTIFWVKLVQIAILMCSFSSPLLPSLSHTTHTTEPPWGWCPNLYQHSLGSGCCDHIQYCPSQWQTPATADHTAGEDTPGATRYSSGSCDVCVRSCDVCVWSCDVCVRSYDVVCVAIAYMYVLLILTSLAFIASSSSSIASNQRSGNRMNMHSDYHHNSVSPLSPSPSSLRPYRKEGGKQNGTFADNLNVWTNQLLITTAIQNWPSSENVLFFLCKWIKLTTH